LVTTLCSENLAQSGQHGYAKSLVRSCGTK
jgi:hypothetical protein